MGLAIYSQIFFSIFANTQPNFLTEANSFRYTHRGHEQMTVSTMSLANSPGFSRHLMEIVLRKYLWKALLVYIDDEIIFSSTPRIVCDALTGL